jgi:DNA polymerase-3 subunit delta
VLLDIAEGRVAPVYLLFGAGRDAATVDDIIAALKARLIEPGFAGFDFESCHAEESNVHLLLQHINQPPMGPGRRLVVIRDIGRLQKKDVEELCRGLAKGPEFTVVVVTAEYDAKLKRVFADAGVAKYVIDFYDPLPGDVVERLRFWARERGMNLTAEAAALLRDIAGADTALLKSEVEKLATAVGKDGKATVETVREMAANSREYTLREYTERALSRDAKGALATLRQLLDWGEEPVRIIWWLATGLLGMARSAAETNGRWPLPDLNRALHRLYEVNRQIVAGYPEPYLLLDAYTVCLACREREDYCRLFAAAIPPEFCLRRPKGARRGKTANGQ